MRFAYWLFLFFLVGQIAALSMPHGFWSAFARGAVGMALALWVEARIKYRLGVSNSV